LKNCQEETAKYFMYAIRECAACVVLVFTLSTFLFGLCVLLLAIEWKIESLWHASRETQLDGSHFFSPSAVHDAWRKAVVGQWNALYARYLKRGASMAYRTRMLVAVPDPVIQDSRAQSRRTSLR